MLLVAINLKSIRYQSSTIFELALRFKWYISFAITIVIIIIDLLTIDIILFFKIIIQIACDTSGDIANYAQTPRYTDSTSIPTVEFLNAPEDPTSRPREFRKALKAGTSLKLSHSR
jgi:hypothetical protein